MTMKKAPKKRVAKRATKRFKVSGPGRQFSIESLIKPADRCYGQLTALSQQQAAEADRLGNLDIWRGDCECGASVGAKKSSEGDHYEPVPRPHPIYKDKPRPALKRDQGKR